MKALFLLAASSAAILAQDLEGTWQGTLTPAPNREIRMAFKITREGDAHRGVYYNVDARRQLALGAITVQGNTVKIAIPAMGGSYEGKFDADGNSIAGALTQGGNSLPLPLKRATAQTAWELPAPPSAPKPLPEGTSLEFEVASIKPSRATQRPTTGFNVTATELRSPNVSLAGLLAFAFELHPMQLTGLPGWADTEGYEIVARLPQGGDPTDVQLRAMLKNLIRSRFSLAFHTDNRELSVYAIRMGKNGRAGIKMTANASGGLRMNSQGVARVRFEGATMAALALQLQLRVLDRPVVDQTGLEGRYDFALDWRPDEFQFPAVPAERRAAATAANDSLPDLFTAFQEQLGLKLEGAKASLPVLVVDKVSRPSEN
jgi:uncharacterized protein (TIGR03435 family)